MLGIKSPHHIRTTAGTTSPRPSCTTKNNNKQQSLGCPASQVPKFQIFDEKRLKPRRLEQLTHTQLFNHANSQTFGSATYNIDPPHHTATHTGEFLALTSKISAQNNPQLVGSQMNTVLRSQNALPFPRRFSSCTCTSVHFVTAQILPRPSHFNITFHTGAAQRDGRVADARRTTSAHLHFRLSPFPPTYSLSICQRYVFAYIWCYRTARIQQ